MKKVAYLILVLLIVACSADPVEVTRIVQVAQDVEVTRLVEVEVTRKVEVEVPVTVEVEVEVEVEKEVTRIVEVEVTPVPTNTPAPTPTNTPAPIVEPIVYEGTGDSIVDVDTDGSPMLVHIVGNTAGRHFAVNNLDSENESIDLLVNTTDPYDGVRPLDFRSDEHTVRFDVSATGPWTIEIFPLQMADRLEIPGTFEGTGDYVFGIVNPDDNADLAIIKGNESGRHFAVVVYSDGGGDLVVNTTDSSYEGTVAVEPTLFLIDVKATGSWSVEITTR